MLKSAMCFNCNNFDLKYLGFTGEGGDIFYEIGNSKDAFEIRSQKQAAEGLEEVNSLHLHRIVLNLCTARNLYKEQIYVIKIN